MNAHTKRVFMGAVSALCLISCLSAPARAGVVLSDDLNYSGYLAYSANNNGGFSLDAANAWTGKWEQAGNFDLGIQTGAMTAASPFAIGDRWAAAGGAISFWRPFVQNQAASTLYFGTTMLTRKSAYAANVFGRVALGAGTSNAATDVFSIGVADGQYEARLNNSVSIMFGSAPNGGAYELAGMIEFDEVGTQERLTLYGRAVGTAGWTSGSIQSDTASSGFGTGLAARFSGTLMWVGQDNSNSLGLPAGAGGGFGHVTLGTAAADVGLFPQLIWDQAGPGNWDQPRWVGGSPGQFPDATIEAIVRTDTVTVQGAQAARALYIESGQVAVAADSSLASGAVNLTGGAGLTVNAGGAVTTSGPIAAGVSGAAPATISVPGGSITLASGQSLYLGPVSGTSGSLAVSAGGTVSVGGALHIGPAGTGSLSINSGTVSTGAAMPLQMAYDSAGAVAAMNISGTGQVIVGGEFRTGAGTSTISIADSGSLTVNGGRLELTGAGTATVNQTGGTVTVNNNHAVLGRLASGVTTYNISGGTFQTAGASGDRNIYMAWDQANTQGTINVSGTGQVISLGNLNMGSQGRATVNQTGGSVSAGNEIRMAENAASRGLYDISAGTLTAGGTIYVGINGQSAMNVGGTAAVSTNGRLEVGYNTTGTVTQTAGSVTVNNNHIVLGRHGNANATYDISGGTLRTVGGSGNRNFYMAWDNSASRATLNISNAAAVSVADTFYAGGNGQATINQTGGTFTMAGQVHLGENAAGRATYNLSGGSLTAGSHTYVGFNGQATLNLSGASTALTVNNGQFEIGYNNAGTVNQTGGTATVNNNYVIIGRQTGGNGTYNISSGVLKTAGTTGNRRLHLGWDNAATVGRLNISGDAQVIVNADNVSGTTGLLAAEQGQAYITIADNAVLTINAIGESEGGLSLGRNGNAKGFVTQTGGTVTINNNHFIAGWRGNSEGTYDISGGVLKTAGASGNRRMHLGWDNATNKGTMTIRGTGQVITNADNSAADGSGFYVGNNGTGTLNVADSGSLTVYARGEAWQGGLAVAINNGTSTVNQTGGTVTVNDNYLMIGRYNSAYGIYNLSGGTLTVTGTGNLNTHLGWDSANARGEMNVSGTGVANLGSGLYLGNAGTGTVTVSGGAVNVAGPTMIGYGGTGRGTMTLSGGAVNSSQQTVVGYSVGSTGTLNLNGGVLTTPLLARGAGSASVTFNGGTLRAGASQSINLPLNVQAGGATIDTNGQTVALNGALSGAGGLAKTGAGTLILAGANSYDGATEVRQGTIKLADLAPPVSGAVYHLDASDAASVLRTGDSVYQWNDRTANGLHFYQSNASQQPTFAPGGLNGHDAVYFDAANQPDNDRLAQSAGSNVQSVFMALQANSSLRHLAGLWGQSGGDFGIRWNNSVTRGWLGDANNNDWGSPAGSQNFITGAPGGYSPPGTAYILTQMRSSAVSRTWAIGDYWSSNNRSFGGYIGEVLTYGSALSTEDRIAIEAYLTAKWLGSTTDNIPDASPVVIASGATLNLNGHVETVGPLSGPAGASVLLGGGIMIVNSTADAAYAGSITGPGSLVKSGGLAQYFNGPVGTSGVPVAVSVSGGLLGGVGPFSGPIAILPGGAISAGNSPGHMVVSGSDAVYDYAQTGTMLAEIGGYEQGDSYDWIEVFGRASLAGTIDVDWANSFIGHGPFYVLTATEGIDVIGELGFEPSGARYGEHAWRWSIEDWGQGGQALRLDLVPEPASALLLMLAVPAVAARLRRRVRR